MQRNRHLKHSGYVLQLTVLTTRSPFGYWFNTYITQWISNHIGARNNIAARTLNCVIPVVCI